MTQYILKNNETIHIKDITITLYAGGHRITEKGDRNLADIEICGPNSAKLRVPIRGDGEGKIEECVKFGMYIIHLIEIDWNGMSVTLSVK